MTLVTRYSTDMLYPSPFPWVVNSYLFRKVSEGGFWFNWGGVRCETRIVSPSDMTIDEYQEGWVALNGTSRGTEGRFKAMTECPLLKTLYGISELR